MTGVMPTELSIDATTGALSPATGRISKRLSQLEGVYQDADAWMRSIQENADPVVYEVNEFKKDGSDLFFGTTTMQPGKVGEEFYMTRGHFHLRRDMGEFYCTQQGRGLLLLQNRDGKCEKVDMRTGTCAFIPPDWAHRSINTGSVPLVFTWVCNTLAGHDYDSIASRGMRMLAVERSGKVELVSNPKFL